jgi:UDP-N-acetylglucosamine 4,6-dehydratase
MFNKQNILITGGTGSFGNAFVNYIMRKYNPKKIIIFSRDEVKQRNMMEKLNKKDLNKFRFFLGDVRDFERLNKSMQEVDYVIHAAALKQVDTAEYNPFEFIKTNINGAYNVIEASLRNKVKKVIALSTDKAAQSINLYGATKLVSDKLFVSANSFKGKSKTIFSVVRYGNVAESRGSVIPLFQKLIQEKKPLTLTDKNMTRFWITLKDSVEFVDKSFKLMSGGEIFVPKLKSFRVVDLIKAMTPSPKIKVIGIRPGEKLHEVMCPREYSHKTLEFEKFYVIYPTISIFMQKDLYKKDLKKKSSKKVNYNFEYSSDKNDDFFTINELKKVLKKLKVLKS